MRNKKAWLILKAGLILVLAAVIIAMPTDDPFRKWFRFIMLVLFVISFLVDLNTYKKGNG